MTTLTSLLTELEEKAKEATPGPWQVEDDTPGVRCVNFSHRDPAWRDWIAACSMMAVVGQQELNAAHIAACNPDTILRLIAVVRELVRQRDETVEFGYDNLQAQYNLEALAAFDKATK